VAPFQDSGHLGTDRQGRKGILQDKNYTGKDGVGRRKGVVGWRIGRCLQGKRRLAGPRFALAAKKGNDSGPV
jgi:hypothetical protein